MKKLVLTGSTGYIGKNILSNIYDNLEIYALCRDKKKLYEYFEHEKITNKNVHVINLEDFYKESFDLKGAYLLNLAFPRNTNNEEIIKSFDFISDLYTSFVKNGGEYIINISSQSVYDINRKEKAFEDDLIKPFSVYGLAKVAQEVFTKEFSIKNKVSYINVRLGSIVGPGFEQRIINKLIRKYRNNEDIEIFEANERFSYIHVKDAINGFMSIINSDTNIFNSVYNLGTNESYILSDIIAEISKLDHDYNGKINIVEKDNNFRTNEVDICLISKFTGYMPRFDLGRIIQDINSKI